SAQLRALAARAVLDHNSDGKDLQECLKIFQEDFKTEAEGKLQLVERVLAPKNTAVTATTDIRIALRSAMALNPRSQNTPASRSAAIRLVSGLDWRLDPGKCANPASSRGRRFMMGLGLLGFVAGGTVMNVVSADAELLMDSKETVEKGAGMLRQWC